MTLPHTLVLARRIGIVLAMIAILFQPGYGTRPVDTQVADIEVLVVVDRTRSMAALDHAGGRPRIEGVKADLDALAQALPGARMGLLTFGFDVRLELPFTSDTNAFTSAVDTLRLETPTGGIGSSVDRPKEKLLDVLQDAQEQQPDRRRILVFVSDGERTTDTAPRGMEEVGDYVAGGLVLGYGTTEGARMPAASDLSDDEGFVQDPSTGEAAISKADPDALRDLAAELGVDFVERTGGSEDTDMATLAEDFEASYVPGTGDESTQAAHDLTWVVGLVLLALVLLELREGWRAVWTSRNAVRDAPAGGAGGR